MEKLYNHVQSEKEAQELWAREQIYAFNNHDQKQVFSIDTPPPTVSGTLHIGHIFSYTHADLIARYKRMQGYSIFYPMGFDDNGLPTERYVEKKNGIKAYLMKRSEFINLCLKETEQVERLFEDLWKNIGLSIDWLQVYSTISQEVRKISQYSFIELYKKGLAYRRQEPSLYCTTCRTSVAQAELESLEVSTTFNDLIFETEDGEQVTIATTRPELLPACVAVFYHPDDLRYKKLTSKYLTTPLFNKQVLVLADAKVDPEKGSGLVMCCTFGDQTDIQWYKTHELPFIHIVGLDGTWTQGSGPLAGLKVHEARKKILELLKEQGKLKAQKAIAHHVNTHERCKQEIEYLLLTQWFIKILENKQLFLDLADQIEWKPDFMKARYRDWVQNLSWDWGISRQRFFGIPFPVWHCVDCQQVIVADEKDLPIDPQEKAYLGKNCPSCKSHQLVPDTDVMDTWNTSALTPQINAGWPEKTKISLPMSLRPQAHDIIRTWAFDTIVKAAYHHNNIPWNTIMISGHVLAGKEKISKSKGNEKLSPDVLLQQFPADAIRFWASSGKLGMDTAFSENQLKIGQKLITKLWNAFRFLHDHINDYQPHDKPTHCGALNEWLLHTLSQAVEHYNQQFNDYEYSHALEVIEKFFWQNFCDNYLELVKDQFFRPERYDQDSLDKTRFTLYEVGFGILQMYAPFVPHITETLYQSMFKRHEQKVSLHATLFNGNRFSYQFIESVATSEKILEIVAQVRKLKSENHVSLKTELSHLTLATSDQKLLAKLKKQEALITGITKATTITYHIGSEHEQPKTDNHDVLHAWIRI
jgi:valyl-tRNA synthetase